MKDEKNTQDLGAAQAALVEAVQRKATLEEEIAAAIEGTPIAAPIDLRKDGKTLAGGWPLRATSAAKYFEKAAPKPRAIFHHEGTEEPFIPAGKVGLVSGTGGAGKTTWLLRLAMAYAGGFAIDGIEPAQGGGNVLYVCGEESEDELHGRIQRGFNAILRGHEDKPWGLHTREEAQWCEEQGGAWRQRIGERLHVVSLSGIDATLVEEKGKGALKDSDRLALVRLYAHRAQAKLVIVDPLARFNAARGEIDNAAATAVVRAFEKLTYAGGRAGDGPTVLIAHHVSKGSASALEKAEDQELQRGASALTDGVRWQMNLVAGTNTPASKDGQSLKYQRTWGLFITNRSTGEKDSKAIKDAWKRLGANGLEEEEFADARVVRTYIAKHNAGATGDGPLYALHKGQLYLVTCVDEGTAQRRAARWRDAQKAKRKSGTSSNGGGNE